MRSCQEARGVRAGAASRRRRICAGTSVPSWAAPSVPAVRRRHARFDIAPYDFAAAERLGADLGVSHVLAQVLVRRGLADPAAAPPPPPARGGPPPPRRP